MTKASITCIHCGGMFTAQISFSGSGTVARQHNGSGGCGKPTKVMYSGGSVVGTKK